MKTIIAYVCTLAVVSVVVAGAPPIPATPAAIDDVVYSRAFTLEKGYDFDWCKERPLVTSGTILVLKVNPDLVIPRQVAEPVLYVGNQTAQRVNFGNESGHVIAIVPGDVDLSKSPIWFGTPELPERVDAAATEAERAKADAAGIKPPAAAKIAVAVARGGERLNVADMSELLRSEISDLILQYSPQEKHLAEDFNTPVAKPTPKPKAD
ncbi:MAG: hypothetical protein V2A79_11005 [Planctomycetota bacterium]